MPKRRHCDPEEITRKIRKLERKLARRRQRRECSKERRERSPSPPRVRLASAIAAPANCTTYDTYSEDEFISDEDISPFGGLGEHAEGPASTPSIAAARAFSPSDHVSASTSAAAPISTAAGRPAEASEVPAEILAALGDGEEEAPNYGGDINEEVAKRWSTILKAGLPKDLKAKLSKQCLVPANCTLLKAPKLNPEITLTVNESSKNRDKKIEAEQNQLGLGIANIGESITYLITTDAVDKVTVVQKLSDAARILTDLHYHLTDTRRKIIATSLDKTFNNIANEATRDEFLFGDNLTEKIRNTKAIEKSGLQIKKTSDTLPKKNTFTPTPAYRNRLNWNGPPRNTGTVRTMRTRGGGQNANAERAQHGLDEQRCGQRAEQAQLQPATQPPGAAACPTLVETASSVTPSTYPGCRDALRSAFRQRKIPECSLDIMLASLSSNTIKQYDVTFCSWWQFCNDNNSNCLVSTPTHIISFLTEKFKNGASYGTLNSHRSALSLLIGNNIGSDDALKRFLKGAFRLRPTLPKYSCTWDPTIVLDHISSWYPNENLSLSQLTKKCVILLALSTGHRVQTLSLIKTDCIKISTSEVVISIIDLIKTSSVGRDQPILTVPFFTEKPHICPAKTLVDYQKVTRSLRSENEQYLILTIKRPHKRASPQTISGWIKLTLAASGIDTSMFTAHSTRHASTSAAYTKGVSIDTIRKTAGWSHNSSTFARFYNRPLTQPNESFAEAVIRDK